VKKKRTPTPIAFTRRNFPEIFERQDQEAQARAARKRQEALDEAAERKREIQELATALLSTQLSSTSEQGASTVSPADYIARTAPANKPSKRRPFKSKK
jgi:hypothetical protein